jgi:Antitoxin VbhA
MTRPDAEQRRHAAANALASLALDDLEPTDHTHALLDAAVRGDLTADQLYDEVLRHAQQGGQP